MFRLWAREFYENRVVKDTVIEDGTNDTRTHKVFRALAKACAAFDLTGPIWLDLNIRDFQRTAKCRFTQDSFLEEIPFDYLEIQVVEED